MILQDLKGVILILGLHFTHLKPSLITTLLHNTQRRHLHLMKSPFKYK